MYAETLRAQRPQRKAVSDFLDIGHLRDLCVSLRPLRTKVLTYGKHMSDDRRYISSGSPWEAMAGYSRAVVDGDWIFVSGTIGQDFATMTMPDTAQAQAERALDTIEAALRDAGATLDDAVRVRVYLTDRADVPAVSAVVKRRLGASRAANTTVCCALAVDGAKVEIEVTARRHA